MEFFSKWRKRKEKKIEEELNSEINIPHGKIFYGNNYRKKMYQVLKEGYRSLTLKDIMIYRLNSLGKPKEEKFWLENTIASSDALYLYGEYLCLSIAPPNFKVKLFQCKDSGNFGILKDFDHDVNNYMNCGKHNYSKDYTFNTTSGLTPTALEEIIKKGKTKEKENKQIFLAQGDVDLLKNFINAFYHGQELIDIVLNNTGSYTTSPLLFMGKPLFTIFNMWDGYWKKGDVIIVGIKPSEVVSLDNNLRERVVYNDIILWKEKIIEKEKPVIVKEIVEKVVEKKKTIYVPQEKIVFKDREKEVPVYPYTVEDVVKYHNLLEKICKGTIESSGIGEMSNFFEHLGKQVKPDYKKPLLSLEDYSPQIKEIYTKLDKVQSMLGSINAEQDEKKRAELIKDAEARVREIGKEAKKIVNGDNVIKEDPSLYERFSKIELD